MKQTEISVLPLNTKVHLCGHTKDPIEGVISAISIRPNFVQYEVVYWSGKERKDVNVEEYEIQPIKEVNKIKIGFKNV